MEFMSFVLPKDACPRFDNACAKSSKLHSRYYRLIGRPESVDIQEIKYVNVCLCRNRYETDFPVDINSCIAETVVKRELKLGKIIKSRNIYSFVKSQKDTGCFTSLMIVDNKAKKDIMKLRKTKFHFILTVEDDNLKTELEEELKTCDKMIAVASKENIADEIDDLLERILLAPLKRICEECFDMLKHKDLAESSTGSLQRHMEFAEISQTRSKKGNVKNRTEIAETSKNKPNGLQSKRSYDKYQPGHRQNGLKTTIKLNLTSAQTSSRLLNGSVVPGDSEEKKIKKEHDHNERKLNATVSPTQRSLFHHNGKLNGFKDTISGTKLSERKEIKRKVHQRSEVVDTLTTQNGKKRKTVLSEKIDLSDTEHQATSSNTDHNKVEDSPEQLIEAILALYGMSNVPEKERPNVPKQSYKVSKEMRSELFQISSTIKRIGYRYRTLYIYAMKPESQADDEERKKQIGLVLEKYRIDNFKIAQCAEHVTELMHVGAKVEVRSGICYSLRSRTVSGYTYVKGGTLGCFASMNDGEEKYGLISKHVSEGCTDVYYVGEGNNIMIGHMLEATNRHQPKGLDISAAVLHEPVSEDSTKFKDTRRTLLKGRLHEYKEVEDDICRGGQPVYIYGAVSDPGKGEITMPCVDHGLGTTLIQVEDEIVGDGTRQTHFAEKGDSGAIVCVEDPGRKNVHAIGMVIGTPDSNDTSRRTYLTLPLSKGLQQLESNTGKTFTLC